MDIRHRIAGEYRRAVDQPSGVYDSRVLRRVVGLDRRHLLHRRRTYPVRDHWRGDYAVIALFVSNDLPHDSWGRSGSNAAQYGLQPNTVYYVASTPITAVGPVTQQTTYSFMISRQCIQTLSASSVPVQDSGKPGSIVDLQPQAGASPLTYGMVKPVSQLGSAQLSAGQLGKNADGSLTLWFSPSLPAGVVASNWIPTPSTAYFNTLYPNTPVSTALQIIIRMYDPTPGNEPPSILPYSDGSTKMPESYLPPALILVSTSLA